MIGNRLLRPAATLAAVFLALGPVAAAELPAAAGGRPLAKKGAEPPKSLPKCDVGGIQGVMTPGGVCLKLSGYVSAGFGAHTLR